MHVISKLICFTGSLYSCRIPHVPSELCVGKTFVASFITIINACFEAT